jgi:hypothetical protein
LRSSDLCWPHQAAGTTPEEPSRIGDLDVGDVDPPGAAGEPTGPTPRPPWQPSHNHRTTRASPARLPGSQTRPPTATYTPRRSTTSR